MYVATSFGSTVEKNRVTHHGRYNTIGPGIIVLSNIYSLNTHVHTTNYFMHSEQPTAILLIYVYM